MKKIVRLTETDVQRLVKKIIREEKKSINEGPLGWLRKKRNSDEELGLLILKGLEKGDVQNVTPLRNHDRYTSDHAFTCTLDGHEIMVSVYYGHDTHYQLKVDGEMVEVSRHLKNKIYDLIEKIEKEPAVMEKKRKLGDIKTRLSKYNLPDEERAKIDNTDDVFKQLYGN